MGLSTAVELTYARDGTEKHYELYYRFTRDINLPPQIALTNITLIHNWKNVLSTDDYRFTIKMIESPSVSRIKDQTFYDLQYSNGNPIPAGSYGIDDLNNFIHLALNKIEGNVNTERTYPINIYATATYNRVSIHVASGFELVLNSGLSKFLGADAGTTLRPGVTRLPKPANIAKLQKINVHCNLVHNEFQNDSNLLYSFTPSSSIGRVESPKIYFPTNRKTRMTNVTDMRVWVTDQNNVPIDFEENWSVTMLFSYA